MNIFKELRERELIAQSTNDTEIESLLNKGRQKFYIGFDATAKSLHLGHLLQLITIKRLQETGHLPILLLGGGTTMVGDPSGRSDMRQMLDDKEITKNTECFKKQFEHFIDFNDDRATVVNNADWLLGLSYLPFLREVGSHFSVNRMLSADCYKQRMEKGLSFLELNYMVMQSYDFLVLHDKYNCNIQLGGNDQWSNIIAGVELIRRVRNKPTYGMTFNLLTTSEGIKMGKTQKGAIWLDPEMTPPYDLFQYFRNINDNDVLKCLKYLTFIPMNEIHEMENWTGENLNDAKKILAYEVTKLVHDETTAQKIFDSSERLFSGISKDTDMPTTEVSVIESIGILDLLISADIVPSKAEGRRIIQGGGIYLNDSRIDDFNFIVDLASLKRNEVIIRKGKKNYHKISFIAT
jgi:tyrosyl-tRNA synthetase